MMTLMCLAMNPNLSQSDVEKLTEQHIQSKVALINQFNESTKELPEDKKIQLFNQLVQFLF